MKKILITISLLVLISILAFAHLSKSLSGDVNCDGRVSITDLVILHRYVVGYDEMKCPGNADMNGDFVIDMKDVELLRDQLAGVERGKNGSNH